MDLWVWQTSKFNRITGQNKVKKTELGQMWEWRVEQVLRSKVLSDTGTRLIKPSKKGIKWHDHGLRKSGVRWLSGVRRTQENEW